ncbi:MAG TPA: type II/IV secretion system ATPase subunit [Dehalococcoidia bacterium]|nr:type II/IV secretion system ATPase subunit [Dehalococcoidia bacterium]
MLPKPIQEAVAGNIHLLEYLHMVPIEQVGIPQYYAKLTPKLRDLKHPNLIYPVAEGIFTHIYPDPQDGRDCYISVEPILTRNLDSLMPEVEMRLLEFTDELAQAKTEEQRKQVLLSCVDRICTTDGNGNPGRGLFGLLGNKGNGSKIGVSPQEMEAIKYLLIRDKIGLGILEPMIRDRYIEDISCSGLGCIFVEHKIFRGLKTAVTFSSFEELDEFVLRLAERIKKPVTYRDPIVDAVLPDGSRINIVYGKDVSKRGSNFTIRKFSETPLSILELIEFGSLDYMMAAYLSMIISEGMNVFVSGEAASGKTTLLNALTTFIPPNAKIVTIEDTPELQVPHRNWIREVVTQAKTGGEGAGVTMFDLLKAALRQRPNEIIVGEIRGIEGAIAFQAMQTGHAVMATFHAASVEKLIQRITGSPINVPKTYIDNLNVVIIQSAVRLPDGKIGRRALSINEIVGYDPPSDSFSFIEMFRWNPVDDTFEFVGNMNSYLLEQKIALKRGIPKHKKRQIYGELERRAKILEKLHKEQKVVGFYELLQVLAKAQREGLF